MALATGGFGRRGRRRLAGSVSSQASGQAVWEHRSARLSDGGYRPVPGGSTRCPPRKGGPCREFPCPPAFRGRHDGRPNRASSGGAGAAGGRRHRPTGLHPGGHGCRPGDTPRNIGEGPIPPRGGGVASFRSTTCIGSPNTPQSLSPQPPGRGARPRPSPTRYEAPGSAQTVAPTTFCGAPVVPREWLAQPPRPGADGARAPLSTRCEGLDRQPECSQRRANAGVFGGTQPQALDPRRPSPHSGAADV